LWFTSAVCQVSTPLVTEFTSNYESLLRLKASHTSRPRPENSNAVAGNLRIFKDIGSCGASFNFVSSWLLPMCVWLQNFEGKPGKVSGLYTKPYAHGYALHILDGNFSMDVIATTIEITVRVIFFSLKSGYCFPQRIYHFNKA
jgi:hypothetical protein